MPCSAHWWEQDGSVFWSVCSPGWRPAPYRHLSWQAGPSRPGAKIRPQAASLSSPSRSPYHSACMVCVSQSGPDRAVLLIKGVWNPLGLITHLQEELSVSFGRNRESRKGRNAGKAVAWIKRFRTARRRCGEYSAERIIEACMCLESESKILRCHSVCPKAGRLSGVVCYGWARNKCI